MEQAILDWGRQNYPRLLDNTAMIEALYRTKFLNQPTMQAQAMSYPLVKASAIQPETPVTLLLTKVESSVRSYDSCPECKRAVKNCTDWEHKAKQNAIPTYILTMKAGDDTGMETVKKLGADEVTRRAVEQGEEFLVSGTLHVKEKYGREFDAKLITGITREQLAAWDSLQQFAEIHGGEAGISEEEFKQATAGKDELLKPFFAQVFIRHLNGRVGW